MLARDSPRLVLARAEYQGVLDLEALYAALGPGRPGSTAIHAALATHLPQLVRFAWEDVHLRPDAVVAELRRLLG